MEYFTIRSNEIEGRIDPLYYSSDIFQILRKLRFEIKTIGEIATYVKTGFPAGANLQSHNEQGIIQIRPTNIDENNLLSFEKNIYIKPEIAEKKRNELLKKGEVLFNNTNSQELVGKTAYFDLDGKYFCSNHITRIKVNEELVLPKYLWVLLNQYQKNKVFFKLCTNWNNQSGVNIELLKNIKIPIPSLSTQNKIVQLMDNAYNLKKQKETEAQQLLDSINDYVLSELGIKLPELKDQMTFVVYTNDIKGGRVDPRYYKPIFLEFVNELIKRKDIKYLGEISKYIGSGATPKAGGSDYTTKEEGIPFIRIINLKNNTIVLDEDTLYIKRNIHEGMLKRTQLKTNDVLLTMAGTIGVSVVVPKNIEEANINQAIARIVLKEDVNPFYLSAVLNSQIGKIQTDRYSRPSVQANINLEEIRNLKIPLPPLEVQNKIAEEVKRRMQKAEELQKEAKEVLERAKREVENIIFNGGAYEG